MGTAKAVVDTTNDVRKDADDSSDKGETYRTLKKDQLVEKHRSGVDIPDVDDAEGDNNEVYTLRLDPSLKIRPD